MAIEVKPNLIEEIKEFGAFDVSACFNCGTCTATCPLSENNNEFPRGMIRLAQLGQKDKLVASKELWICHYCGDCTAECPRGANPAEFMHSARKYVIATVDPFGVTKRISSNKIFTLGLLAFIAVVVGYMLNESATARWFGDDYLLLGGYYGEIIHITGMTMGIFMGVTMLIGTFRLYQKMVVNEPLRKREYIMDRLPWKVSLKLGIKTMLNMIRYDGIKQERFIREDPLAGIEVVEGNYPDYALNNQQPSPSQIVSRRVIHLSIVAGFFGLAIATAFDYLVKDILMGDPGTWVPIYHPIRILGIVSGLSMMFGTSMSMYYRWNKPDDSEYYKNTRFEDWLILILIWLLGCTGFVLTTLVYLPTMPSWAGWALVVHVIVAYQLFVLMPFTKFAHVFYRPLALWLVRYEDAKVDYLSNLAESVEEKLQEVTA